MGMAEGRQIVQVHANPPWSEGDTNQVTVGTSAVQITATSTPIKTVTVKADNDNAGNVYVGFSSGVTTGNGFRLAAGEAITIPIDDLSKIWLIADAADQLVHYIYLN